jgi:monoamine oxidase
MSRTNAFSRLARTLRIARWCDVHGVPSREGVERALDLERRALVSRREVLTGLAATGALAALPPLALGRPPRTLDVGIVGAGLAGLACADRLRARGVVASVYEASDRVGGRCWSLRGFFPGQVAERGGELIDNLHKTMLGYANAFKLAREDYEKHPGDVFYFFDGIHHDEAAVVDEYRAFNAAMRADLQRLSNAPSADAFNAFDAGLDRMTIAEYLETRGAGPLLTAVLGEAYLGEYGRELDEQNCLNLLLFVKVDKRSRFMPFGVSDERYHLVDGNDAIALGIAAGLRKPVEHGLFLVRVRKISDGRIELTFRQGNRTVVRSHEAVVLTVPFTVLRTVDLDASLELPSWKRLAIDELGYGTNAKQIVAFDGPFWNQLGSSGTSYSDLEDHQITWETNHSRATPSRAILTDYASGNRGAGMDPRNVQQEADRFVTALDQVFPGALAGATQVGGRYLAHLEHWPSNPLALGSYTCYLPGQFTTIAGNEGKPVGNLFFAGEHANSFYTWQGFMEGAALSGIDAANLLL